MRQARCDECGDRRRAWGEPGRGQLVSDEAAGAQRVYRLEPEGVDAIRAYFERLWGEVAVRYRIAADNTKRR